MPDLDVVEKKLSPWWRVPYRLIKGQQPIDRIAEALLKALAKELREFGGPTKLLEVAELASRRDRGLLNDRAYAGSVRSLEARVNEWCDRLLLDSALRRPVWGLGSILLSSPEERVATSYLVRLVESRLFSHRNYLVGKSFSSLSEALEFETDILGRIRPQLGAMARRLVKDPSAQRVRAPRYSEANLKSTKDLLDEPLV